MPLPVKTAMARVAARIRPADNGPMSSPWTASEQIAASRWLRWPPWLFSVAVHLAVAVLGCLLVRWEMPPRDLVEADRPAAIVLVSRGAENVSYFSEDQTRPADSAPSASAAGGALANDALTDSAPPDAGIKLPDLPGGLMSGQGLVPAVAPGTGRGRPKLPFSTIDEEAVLAADALVPREVQPTGPTAKMSLFGSAAEGRSFVFAIDHSQSMGGDGLGAIAAAAKELAAQVTTLTSEQTLQVVSYNQTASYFSGRELIAASDENKAAIVRFVANLSAAGPTEHERGLRAALALKPEVIFLLTDGGDPHLKPAQIRTIADLAGTRTTIHSLHFGRSKEDEAPADHFLRRLATTTRGSYTFIAMSVR
jgi:hypothetical protein